MVCTLKLGWTKQRAAAIILAVRGPLMPIVLKYSSMFGVSLNGTGRLASRSPASHTMEYMHSHPHQFYQCIITFLWWLMDLNTIMEKRTAAYTHKKKQRQVKICRHTITTLVHSLTFILKSLRVSEKYYGT